MTNPLLTTTGLPDFAAIQTEHVVPAIRTVLADAQAAFEALEKNLAPTWERTIGALELLDRPFDYAWKPVNHLFGVKNSPELRKAYETILPEVIEFGLRVRQSDPLYRTLKALRDGPGWKELSSTRQRIVNDRILEAELAGIGLTGAQRERFNAIEQELSRISTLFSNNVLDASKAYALDLTNPADMEGTPETLRSLAANAYSAAHPEGPKATSKDGPWRITLEIPIFSPFMAHCRNRSLREQVYKAYVTRASSGATDNNPLIDDILRLRREKAMLVGYPHYAAYSLARKMAESVEAVDQKLAELLAAGKDAAKKDFDELASFQKSNGDTTPLARWDLEFWSERLRESKYDYKEEQLRPYFPFERVLQGLFSLLNKLFGITVAQVEHVSVWNSDVRYYEIRNEAGQAVASFYLDPYSRPENKRPGAWMDDCLGRKRLADGTTQKPVAHLVCNQTPPMGEIPSLMSFREVETLFHEFGHGLQHMLTSIDDADAAGINGVEWDAVELPSHFMENWCYHRPTLLGLTGHYQTGEPLPEELFDKILAARTYRSGSMLLRQLQFGMTDLELHARHVPGGSESVLDVQRRIAAATSILPMIPEDRSLCAFQHIFSGGYAAGYYSYKWAEILAADAFSAFEEAGLENEAQLKQVGRRFRDTILSLGGSKHPLEVFRAFRGRDPSIEALLRHAGLLPSGA